MLGVDLWGTAVFCRVFGDMINVVEGNKRSCVAQVNWRPTEQHCGAAGDLVRTVTSNTYCC